ncbi:MAG: polyphosphate kinase 1, partial [Planctomycetes bacterium]|nr:polyphosphate kinase 1 [Planctomycetota bacterium]
MPREESNYINRELSWLEFNQRVLDEALDPQIPLLERLKFLAITASNLDEFFMVRVGGLQMLARGGRRKRDPAGLTPARQLKSISRRVHQFVAQQYDCLLDELEPGLAEAGLRRLLPRELNEHQQTVVQKIFETEVFPIYTPMAVDTIESFPLLINRALNVCVRLKPVDGEREPRFAVIPLGPSPPRFFRLPSDQGYHYIVLEDVIRCFVADFFPGVPVQEVVPFRITRNADMNVREDMAADLMAGMEEVLDARKLSDCVRLEIDAGVSRATLRFLRTALEVEAASVYEARGPLDLSAFMRLTGISGFDSLRYEPWSPQHSPDVDRTQSMFDQMNRKDILLALPYETFEPVVRWIEEAAVDPQVLAIKVILYRTSRNSPIVAALQRAAERGKNVTALVELKARFDEARNIEWAKTLEQTGAQVIYGVKGLKTHAKVCIVVRREPHGIRRYVHFSTGNYNEVTAKLYSDISYLTTDEELAADATSFFNAITGYSQPQQYRKLAAAPFTLRDRLLELIDGEIARKKEGQKAHIMAQLNSLADPKIIDALYAASKAGVPVDLNVRGICCLKPGAPGLSENIRVVSILDRYLEHSRIIYFHHGGNELLLLSSADWMPRNLDRRIE